MIGALREAEATTKGTKCSSDLFSVSLNPPEMENVRVEVFDAALAAIEEKNGLNDQPEPQTQAYLKAIDVPKGGRIVAIGASTGGVTRQIATRFTDATVLGVEPSAALTRKADALASSIPSLSFSVGDGAALDLGDSVADVSMLRTVLSHVPSPGKLVTEATRILRPGGALVICDADFS